MAWWRTARRRHRSAGRVAPRGRVASVSPRAASGSSRRARPLSSCRLAPEERDDELRGAPWVVEEGPVAAVLEDDDLGAGEALLLQFGLLHGKESVVRPPHDQGRPIQLAQNGCEALDRAGRGGPVEAQPGTTGAPVVVAPPALEELLGKLPWLRVVVLHDGAESEPGRRRGHHLAEQRRTVQAREAVPPKPDEHAGIDHHRAREGPGMRRRP